MSHLHFGDFTLDTHNRVLLRGLVPVHVEPKVFNCIAVLASRAGQLTTARELRSLLWPDAHVGPEALRRVVALARKAIGDQGVSPRWIQTRKRVGYVFRDAVERTEGLRSALRPATAWPFVGREHELSALRRVVERPPEEGGGFCFIAGEAGSGKSALMAELRSRTRANAESWFVGQCEPLAGAPVLFPFRTILARMLERPALGDRWRKLAAGDHAMANAMAELESPWRWHAGESWDENARFASCARLARAFAGIATAEPLVLVLEDAHWADDATLLLIELLGRATPERPLFLFVTYRPGNTDAGVALSRLLGRTIGRHGVSTLNLGGLKLPELRSLLEAVGHPGASGVSAEVLQELTGGNPLFVQQLVQHSLSREALPDGDTPVSLRQIVSERTRSFGPETRALLEVAAVLGRRSEPSLLARVAGCSAESLDAALAPAVAAGVLCPRFEPDAEIRFAHALLRDSLYASVPLERRHTLHAQALRGWEAAPPAALRTFELSTHAFLAGSLVDPAHARDLCEAAGREAMELLAFDRASVHLGRALRLRTAEPASEARAEVALSCARALWELDESANEVTAAFFEAAEQARRAGAPRLFARAAIGAAVGDESNVSHRAARWKRRELDALLEASRALSPDGDDDLAFRVHKTLAWMFFSAGDHDRSQAAARSALSLGARRSGTPADVDRYGLECIEACLSGDRSRASTALEALRAAAGDPELSPRHRAELWLRSMGGALLAQDLPSYVESSRAMEDAVDRLPDWPRFGRLGERFSVYRIVPHASAVTVAIIRGDFAEAERRAAAATTLTQQLGLTPTRDGDDHTLMMLMQLLGYQGRAALVEPLLDHRLATYPEDAWDVALARAQIAVERGAMEDARRQFAVLRETGFRTPHDGTAYPAKPETLIRAADVCSTVGTAADAEALRDALAPWSGIYASDGPLISLGSFHRPLGELCAKVGDTPAAVGYFELALRDNASFGHRPEIARTRFGLARALLASGRKTDATAHARAALSEALSMNMELLAGQCRHLAIQG